MVLSGESGTDKVWSRCAELSQSYCFNQARNSLLALVTGLDQGCCTA